MNHFRRGVLALGLAALMLWGAWRGLGLAARSVQSAAGGTGSVIYRFDSGSQTFITLPLPIGSWPTDIEVAGTNPTEVWVADNGLGQLTRIVYTGTQDYAVKHFTVTTSVNNRPFRLALNAGRVWFTAPNTNRVGRLDPSTGQVDEFSSNGLPVNAGLTDIKVAPGGKVWVGAETARRLMRLTVTSTVDYAFTSYTDTARPSFVVAPYAIAIENDNSILMTVPTAPTPTLRLAQLTPSSGFFVWLTLVPNSFPQDLVIVPGELWFSDRNRDELSDFSLGTWTILNPHGPITKPTSLAAQSSNVFWSVLQTRPAAIGRLTYSEPITTVTSFLLPDGQFSGSSIAVAADGGVWVSAYRGSLFLPLIRKS